MTGLRVENAIDLHCHFGPDTVGGSLDASFGHGVSAYEAAREARDSGHRALVLKSHSFASPALAANLSEAVDGLQVFGGICTDFPSGGLNVSAVEAALAIGAKIVWLPTVHSAQDVSGGNRARVSGPGIKVIGDDGKPVEAVREMFSMIKSKDAILATGHTSAAEHYAVVKEFARAGKVLVTHAGEGLAGPKLTPHQCAELADLGATIELTALTCQSIFGASAKSLPDMVEMIRVVGPGNCTLSSDYGWSAQIPRPAPGLRDFLTSLWEAGIEVKELEGMVSQNPARLLGIG